ncbi:YesL family protein [Paucisalibacillus globulus]|uniref:YesL family protein n=1 Tax=Paucisalibacillus globulus TaxID=351095 RepID=UPI000403454D|nr:YesL family protein [Paucisalibacillus globulus]
MNGFVGGYYRFSVWVTRFAYLNLLWIGFSVIGLLLFGFFPATAAMFAVVRKWINKDTDIPIFQTFWKAFKKEFIRINMLGLVLVISGYLLIVELQILRTQEHVAYLIASYTVIGLLLIYAIVLLYIFPMFSHFQLKLTHYFKWAFLIGIGHPILTIVLFGGVIAIQYFAYATIPILLLFFGGSITAYILMWGASQVFMKYEKVEV